MTVTIGEKLPEVPGDTARTAQPSVSAVPDAVMRIPVNIQVVIGSARLSLAQVAQLGPGSVMTLEQKLGTPAVILVNGREIAKGELFVLDGEGDRLGITITEVAGAGRAAAP